MNSKVAAIIAIGLVISAVILGGFFYQSWKSEQALTVTGAAVKKFESDMVKWRVTLHVNVDRNSLKEGYKKIDMYKQGLFTELKAIGIKEDEINVNPVNVFDSYGKDGPQGYNLDQVVYVVSTNMDQIEQLAINPAQLAEKGIIIQNSNLEYFYSEIDTLKKDIIADATLNARERAEKMLVNTDMKVGKIQTIQSGVFQITEPYSTNVASYGIYDTSTRKKQITVTVRAVFEIK